MKHSVSFTLTRNSLQDLLVNHCTTMLISLVCSFIKLTQEFKNLIRPFEVGGLEYADCIPRRGVTSPKGVSCL